MKDKYDQDRNKQNQEDKQGEILNDDGLMNLGVSQPMNILNYIIIIIANKEGGIIVW